MGEGSARAGQSKAVKVLMPSSKKNFSAPTSVRACEQSGLARCYCWITLWKMGNGDAKPFCSLSVSPPSNL